MNSRRHRPSCASHFASGLVAAALAFGSLVAPQAATAAKAKPGPSTSKYCAAAKAWLAFETKTLAAGPYDRAWVEETKRLLIPLGVNTPKAQQKYMALFILRLIGDRSLIAGTDAITVEDDIYWLRNAAADAQANVSLIASRNAIDIYTQKTCKINVMKPFRDLAAGFE